MKDNKLSYCEICGNPLANDSEKLHFEK